MHRAVAPALTPARATAGDVHARRWLVVVLLTLAAIIAYVDRVNLSMALVDVDFRRYFGLDNFDRGLVASAFFWSYAICQIPAGWLADRYGTRYPMAASLALWSILTASTALTTGLAWLVALRLAIGVSESPMHPASMRWIRCNFRESRRGLAIGVFMSGSKLGPAIGAVASAWLIESRGWRMMFALMGLGALVWLVPWLLFGRDEDRSAPAAEAAGSAAAGDLSLRTLLATPVLWGTVIGTFCYMYFVYFCLTWMPAYLRDARGLSLGSSGLYTTFSFVGMAIMSIVGGWGADRLIGRGGNPVKVRKAFTIAGFVLASTELIGGHSASLHTALILAVLSLSGLGLTTANYWALTQTLIPRGSIGRIVGVQNCAASAAGIAAPILTGWLVQKSGSYTVPMEAVLVFLAVGVAAYVFLVREDAAFAPASPSDSE